MGVRANNIIRIPSSVSGDFFKHWLVVLRPYHKMTDKEIDIVACFLRKRYELSEKITDPELLDKFLMSEETKKEVREECGIPLSYFQVICSRFKKRGVLVNGRINPKFIPKMRRGEDNFQLLFLFDFSGK